MLRRFVCLLMLSVMLSTLLVACGDAVLPAYTGATTVTLPDAISSNFQSSVGSGTKNAKIVAYSTADAPDKVKSFFVDNFKKNGWDDKTSDPTVTAQNQQLEGSFAGASAIAYVNGSNKAAVLIFPGSVASAMQVTGVSDTGTFFWVITGQAA